MVEYSNYGGDGQATAGGAYDQGQPGADLSRNAWDNMPRAAAAPCADQNGNHVVKDDKGRITEIDRPDGSVYEYSHFQANGQPTLIKITDNKTGDYGQWKREQDGMWRAYNQERPTHQVIMGEWIVDRDGQLHQDGPQAWQELPSKITRDQEGHITKVKHEDGTVYSYSKFDQNGQPTVAKITGKDGDYGYWKKEGDHLWRSYNKENPNYEILRGDWTVDNAGTMHHTGVQDSAPKPVVHHAVHRPKPAPEKAPEAPKPPVGPADARAPEKAADKPADKAALVPDAKAPDQFDGKRNGEGDVTPAGAKPADKPADNPADKPADKPVDNPADKPADKPVDAKQTEKPDGGTADAGVSTPDAGVSTPDASVSDSSGGIPITDGGVPIAGVPDMTNPADSPNASQGDSSSGTPATTPSGTSGESLVSRAPETPAAKPADGPMSLPIQAQPGDGPMSLPSDAAAAKPATTPTEALVSRQPEAPKAPEAAAKAPEAAPKAPDAAAAPADAPKAPDAQTHSDAAPAAAERHHHRRAHKVIGPGPDGVPDAPPDGYKYFRGSVSDEMHAKARSFLGGAYGQETEFEMDGKKYVARVEPHPPHANRPDRWLKGVTIYEAKVQA